MRLVEQRAEDRLRHVVAARRELVEDQVLARAPRSGSGSSPPRGRRARARRARCTRSGASRTADRRRGGRASGGSLVAQRASSDGRWRLGEPPSGGAVAEIWRPGGRKGSQVAVRWVGPTGTFADPGLASTSRPAARRRAEDHAQPAGRSQQLQRAHGRGAPAALQAAADDDASAPSCSPVPAARSARDRTSPR